MRRPERGFTLLEIMVALVVFAIAAMALLRAQNSQLATDQHLEAKTLAHWVALNHLADLRLQNVFPEVGVSVVEVKMAKRRWQVQTKVQATPSPNTRLLTVSVAPLPDDGKGLMAATPEPVTRVTGFLPRAQEDISNAPAS